MCTWARLATSCFSLGRSSGDGTGSVMPTPCPGIVPQVTTGSIAAVELDVVVVGRVGLRGDRLPIRFQALEFIGVVAELVGVAQPYVRRLSGFTYPAGAPSSTDMLQMLIRPSIPSSSIASPPYS
jgi:hypothetical protein